jgi:hypothetical protein
MFPKDRLPNERQLGRDVRFAVGNARYRLRLRNRYFPEPHREEPRRPSGFRPATFELSLSKGSTTQRLRSGFPASTDTMVYGIERIYVSPSRRFAAIVLSQYRGPTSKAGTSRASARS